LARLRKEIALIDKGLIGLLQERMILALEAGYLKICNGDQILQKKVQDEVEKRFVRLAVKVGLESKFARIIIRRITVQSCKEQNKLKKNLKNGSK
jgi:chorismate mutase